MSRGAPLVFTLLALAACSTIQGKRDVLPGTVSAYHELLRWKKYDSAARFRLPEAQPAFLARYLAAEEDLHVDAIEVRAVTELPVVEGEPLGAVVTAVAQAYLLPSTVLGKIVMQERWELRQGSWLLVETDHELVPPADPQPVFDGPKGHALRDSLREPTPEVE